MKETKFVVGKIPCKNCGGTLRYPDRSCVKCSKERSARQYEQKVQKENKTKKEHCSHRLKALKNGYKFYTSDNGCFKCGSVKRYTSNGGCVTCQKQRSSDNWKKRIEERVERCPCLIQNPTDKLRSHIKLLDNF